MGTFWASPPSKAVPDASPGDVLLGEVTLLSDESIKSSVGKVKAQCIVGVSPSTKKNAASAASKKKPTAEERLRDLRMELLSE